MDQYTVRVCAAVLRPGNELLIVRESRRGLERLSLPGGIPNFNESLERAVVREVREETGYDVVPSEIAYLVESNDGLGSDLQLEICFYAQIEGQSVRPDRPGEQILSVEWRSIYDRRLLECLPHATIFASSKRGRYVDRTTSQSC